MMMTAKCKKIKRINHKVKDIQYRYLHYSDCLLLLNYEQQQIVNLCRLIMTVMMFCNINDEDSDTLNKQCLHTIEMTLKSRLIDIIDCYDDDIIDKCMQVVNLAVKECENLLSLMHHKMTMNFLSNQIAQLSKHLAIIAILILNNIAVTNVVADML